MLWTVNGSYGGISTRLGNRGTVAHAPQAIIPAIWLSGLDQLPTAARRRGRKAVSEHE
jgi:hypothetical protein